MRFALNIEGQEGVSWSDWLALADVCERSGFEALFRSDHYSSWHHGEGLPCLDAWGTICGLASVTRVLRLGTLVSPVTFRHPSALAKLAVTADHISQGRIELGLGTGWFKREHTELGFPFPDHATRTRNLEEQAAIVRRSLSGESFDFSGRFHRLRGARPRPTPVQGRLRLILGGVAGRRGASLAAAVADEYNVPLVGPQTAREARLRLDQACHDQGREPSSLPMSVMLAPLVGADADDLRRRTERLKRWLRDPGEMDEGWLVGEPQAVLERLAEYRQAGVARVFFQYHLHEDLEGIWTLAREVVAPFAQFIDNDRKGS